MLLKEACAGEFLGVCGPIQLLLVVRMCIGGNVQFHRQWLVVPSLFGHIVFLYALMLGSQTQLVCLPELGRRPIHGHLRHTVTLDLCWARNI